MPSRVIATCLALIAFSMAIVLGVAAGNPPLTIVWRALLMMLVTWVIGSVIGAMAQHVVTENIASYKIEHPLATEDDVARGMAPVTIDDDIADMATEHEREARAAREARLSSIEEADRIEATQVTGDDNDPAGDNADAA
ncbi:MAG: hypothetical protein ACYTGQ_12040 [Planctomycetota bacterium]|jgi:hypothetical protein